MRRLFLALPALRRRRTTARRYGPACGLGVLVVDPGGRDGARGDRVVVAVTSGEDARHRRGDERARAVPARARPACPLEGPWPAQRLTVGSAAAVTLPR